MNHVDAAQKVRVDEQIQQTARDVLGYYHRKGGFTPGGFTMALILAFEKADSINFAKLSHAYPYLGVALTLMRDGGDEAVREWAAL